jgi:hypothetical protein
MGYCSYSQHFCFCIKPPVILAFMLQTYPTDCDKSNQCSYRTNSSEAPRNSHSLKAFASAFSFVMMYLEKKGGDKACFASEQNDWRFNVIVTY